MLQLTQAKSSGFNTQAIAGYYAAVNALTPKEEQIASPQPDTSSPLAILFSPFLIYGSVILFFALFLGALVIQIWYRTLDAKRTLTSLVIAFIIASVPFSLKTALEITRFQTNAGPDETPRNVEIKQTGKTVAQISWQTQVEKVGAVRYSLAPFNQTQSQVVIADHGSMMKNHLAELPNLLPGVLYELEILSGSKWYNSEGRPLNLRLQ